MDQVSESHREFFRIGFDDLGGSMLIFQVDANPISVEPRAIQIVNLGGGGLYMQTDVDLPIRHGVYATFRFALQGQEFSFRGQLVRKVDDGTSFWYGVTFVDVEEADRQGLISALQKEQIERSRKARTAQR